jgi:type IX secretion system PorP/SprF family membrane protein
MLRKMKTHYIKKIIICLSFILAGIKPVLAQQNIQFTQYVFNSLSVNPAYAGYKEEWFGQMALRKQWAGLNGSPQTGQISFDGIVDPVTKRMGVGLQVTADKLGPQSATSAYANFAYRLRLNADDDRRLSFGLALGVTNYTLDGTTLDPLDFGDRNLPIGQSSNFIPDGRFGIYYYTPKWYIGGSVMDILANSSNEQIQTDAGTTENLKRKRHVYIIAGMVSDLSDNIKIRPSILLKEDFKGPTSADLSAMFILNERFWIGGSYRTGLNLWNKKFSEGVTLTNTNSFSGLIQVHVSTNFRIGYSYDYMLNKLGNAQAGTHEITVGMTFPRSFNRLLSPRFF